MSLTTEQETIINELKSLNDKGLKINDTVFGIPAVYKSELIDGKTHHIEISPSREITKIYVEYLFNEEIIEFQLNTLEDLESFKNIIENKNYYLTSFLGKYNSEFLDILIFKINNDKIFESTYVNGFEIETFYKGNELKIELSQRIDNNLLSDFIKVYSGTQKLSNKPVILRIKGFRPNFIKENQNDLDTLMDSIFFDIKCLKGEYFEVYKYSLLTRRLRNIYHFSDGFHKNNFKLVVKKLIPELVDYLKVAERVNYLPFKFLCYYHILEYFLDKSAHFAIKNRITNLLYKSDFELNSEKYIDEILQSFKDEGNKLKSDKLKIQRVLEEFIIKKELLDFINKLEFKEHFYETQTLELNESIIKLENINVEQDFKFHKLLSDRIYSLRCSIVHSNPDFGKKDAVPFVPSNKNLIILEKEIFLFEEIAKNLILKSRK